MKKKNQRGFTLIEMLLTIAILSLMAGMVLTYSRQAEKTNLLKRMADKLVSDLRKCQSLALAAKEGYPCGLHLDSAGSYIIFSDKNRNRSYDSGEQISQEKLVQGIKFNTPGLSFVFTPPLGEVLISSGTPPIYITLQLENNSNIKKTITITTFGSISY